MSTRKYPDDFINKIICGDCLEVMKEMPDKCVDVVICSPPYWGLRDYGTGPDQLGLEPTPEFYIEHLTEIFNEAKRVLKKEGTLWLNIGDTYGGSWQDYGSRNGGQRNKQTKSFPRKGSPQFYPPTARVMPKCLLMIPERLAWSFIQNGWILRNKIVWYKPNAMPSSVTDRFSNRWEYLFMFSKSQKYYFDLDAVREPYTNSTHERMKYPIHKIPRAWADEDAMPMSGGKVPNFNISDLGKNPGEVFEINTQPFPEAHFAVFPEKLCEKPIKAGCPEEVCKKCGKARERIVETVNPRPDGGTRNVGDRKDGYTTKLPSNPYAEKKEIGWTSCDCNAGFEGGIVLDPFCGAGTALYVAKEMKRRFIGIDIKQEYCDMCEKRLAQGVL